MAIENNENYIKFIRKYRSLNELWDITSDKYKDRNLKKQAYDKLLKEAYKNIDKDATVETVKNRIKNMRSAYGRELKKKIQKERSGNFDWEPKLWYFNEFDFLRSLELNNPCSSVDEEEASMSPSTLSKKPRIVLPARGKRSSRMLEESAHSLQTVEKFECSPVIPENNERSLLIYEKKDSIRPAGERDEADIYADAWACSYRKLSVEQQLFAKKACDEIFILGQLGKLTLHSVQT